ncbi:UDP-glucose/GDP-mannose dehydrogenase family protein [Yoonia sp. F2084L]|uniref:UDP-glucose dehydrogenase family protein n=1 Tax=Yoonia sp. F2084L TaxID=2926419 RepID=UPI001FF4AA45|nr:UDP-glucose/GDP-mannose dehydrogenase family protein [Yoonia sp. F2084L]MCK0097073.1 UDP-glucose/GDP-mannose dehydrogenase family protein [Yoonia sp. F2084L]
MKIAMIGTGYVGLVSGVCFSDFGHEVICVDKNQEKLTKLRAGETPIFEPGLDTLMARNIAANRLSFTDDLKSATQDADAVFIAVGTPSRRGDGHADLSFVFGAVKEVAEALTRPTVIVIKSTVPVGTNQKVADLLKETRPDLDCDVVSNPEFLREGAAIDDFMHPDRVVVGVQSDRGDEVMQEVYRPLSLRGYPVLTTDLETAEMIKYAANAFLATKVTFINEIAMLCERTGADVKDVANGMGFDSRIGPKFLQAGPGYGGSCFPKDTKALARIGQDNAVPLQIVETVIKVNEEVKRLMIDKIVDLCDEKLRDKTIAVLGLTFKPDTDDMRDAPALTVVPALVGMGANVRVVDPQAFREADALLPNVTWFEDAYEAVDGADAVVLLTEWNEFRALDLRDMAGRMASARMADLRNMYSCDYALDAGFEAYTGMGRKSALLFDS